MNILIVDDHPITVEGYINCLSGDFYGLNPFIFIKSYNCEQAYFKIMKTIDAKKSFDIAIIDKSLPGYSDKSILSGSDLAIFIRKMMSNCKIIMITGHTEIVIIYEIYKRVRPEGLIIKSDITSAKLRQGVMEVITGNPYQSPMVKNCINEIWEKEVMAEDYNRQILLYLSKGFKIKELESVIYLTTSAIEKRIARMKKVFEVTDNSGLVKEAIKQGFI